MTKRVLIFGASSFTGRYLYDELRSNGYEVYGTSTSGSAEYPWIYANILETPSIKAAIKSINPQIVINLIGVSNVAHADKNEIYQVNLIGCLNLLKTLHQNAIKLEKTLLVSSANVYGNVKENILEENVDLSPSNDYGVSKFAMEKATSLWQERIPILIVRPFNYTGHGQKYNFLIPKLVSHFGDRKGSIKLGNLEVSREFNDVRTVVKIYRLLIESNLLSKAVNVCTGDAYSLSEVLQMMTSVSGHEIQVEIDDRLIRTKEIDKLVGSTDFLESIIGKVEPIKLNDTLAWMYQKYLEQ